jgi:hypothetical protein
MEWNSIPKTKISEFSIPLFRPFSLKENGRNKNHSFLGSKKKTCSKNNISTIKKKKGGLRI